MNERSYFLVIGEREALAWIIRESRMAFSSVPRKEITRLKVGDSLFVTTTRGCFHSPGRDRTRVIGLATVASPVAPLPEPLVIAGRPFVRACDLKFVSLAPYRKGVELAPLASALSVFSGTASWGMRMRRALLELPSDDRLVLSRELAKIAGSQAEYGHEYLASIRPVNAARA